MFKKKTLLTVSALLLVLTAGAALADGTCRGNGDLVRLRPGFGQGSQDFLKSGSVETHRHLATVAALSVLVQSRRHFHSINLNGE